MESLVIHLRLQMDLFGIPDLENQVGSFLNLGLKKNLRFEAN
jgi:hypothetical protein